LSRLLEHSWEKRKGAILLSRTPDGTQARTLRKAETRPAEFRPRVHQSGDKASREFLTNRTSHRHFRHTSRRRECVNNENLLVKNSPLGSSPLRWSQGLKQPIEFLLVKKSPLVLSPLWVRALETEICPYGSGSTLTILHGVT
jgi:hypothetical protein